MKNDPHLCPFCGAGRDFWHDHGTYCDVCGSANGHRHYGVQSRGCGKGVASLLARLWRWCWRSEPHVHHRCTVCGARWGSLVESSLLLQVRAAPYLLLDKDSG